MCSSDLVVTGMCFAAAVTALVGTVDIYAASKAEEACEAAIKEYKAEVEKGREAEKAQIKEIRDEAVYRTEINEQYANIIKVAEAYVKAVAEQSRGLDVNAIKDAEKFSRELIDNQKYWNNYYRNNYKTEAEENEFWLGDWTEEKQKEYERAYKAAPKDPFWTQQEDGNWKESDYNKAAYEKAWKAVHPDED